MAPGLLPVPPPKAIPSSKKNPLVERNRNNKSNNNDDDDNVNNTPTKSFSNSALLTDDSQETASTSTWSRLHCKNKNFTMEQEAIVKLQAFVRGCLSRAKTSAMIQRMIEEILEYRQAVAKYALEDEQRQKEEGNDDQQNDNDRHTIRQQRTTAENYEMGSKEAKGAVLACQRPWKQTEDEEGFVRSSRMPVELSLKEVLQHWETKATSSNTTSTTTPPAAACTEKDQTIHHDANDSSSSQQVPAVQPVVSEQHGQNHREPAPVDTDAGSGVEKHHNVNHHNDNGDDDPVDPIVGFPSEYMGGSEPGGSRGYQRYRTTATRKNKRRPWRDDTTVFDAY